MLHYVMSPFCSFTLPSVRLHYTALPYLNLCYTISVTLQYLASPQDFIPCIALPCLALPLIPFHYTTFRSANCCKHLLVNHFLFLVLSYATLHNISITLFNIVDLPPFTMTSDLSPTHSASSPHQRSSHFHDQAIASVPNQFPTSSLSQHGFLSEPP